MWDTLIQSQSYEIDARYWIAKGFVRNRQKPYLLCLNILNCPRLTVALKDRISHLSVEYSIPKQIYGHNALLPASEAEALEAVASVSDWTSQIIRKPFDKTVIRRIDFAKDFFLGERTGKEVSHELHRRHLAKMTRRSYEDTLYWERPRSRWTCQVCVYEKLPQVLAQKHQSEQIRRHAIEAATGKFRLEVRLRGKGIDRLHKVAGGRTPKHLIDAKLSVKMIEKYVRDLDIERILADDRIDFFDLAESANLCTKERGITRFINLVLSHGPLFYKNPQFNWPKRTFFHYRKKCIQAGFWENLVRSSTVEIS